MAAIVLLGGCHASIFGDAVLKEGDVADLPEQPPVTGDAAAPTAVVIVLPPDLYQSLPPRVAGSGTATEAQLDLIEDYGLHLDSDDRELLEDRVNDCRFTAHDSCTIQPAAPPAAKG